MRLGLPTVSLALMAASLGADGEDPAHLADISWKPVAKASTGPGETLFEKLEVVRTGKDFTYFLKNFPFARLAVCLLSLLLLISPRPLFSQSSSPSSPDFDGNGVVDHPDFLLFANVFGSKEGQEKYEPKYDLDEIGEIGILDFPIFVGSVGQTMTYEPTAPVLVEDHFVETTLGNPDGVYASVVDGIGFAPGEHGQRITDIFLANTNHARLVQIGGWGAYLLNDMRVSASNQTGYIRHALKHDAGIFWTATDNSPAYAPATAHNWFMENNRAFHIATREFAVWMQNRNTLFISSLENPTVDDSGPLYCDDFDSEAERWIPLCGVLDDYIAHSGTGLANTVFVGAIKTDPRFDDLALGAIRADGVFAPHAIYVESPDGSTSQATPVLAAYATNLAHANPTWSATRLKQELMKLARDETIRYYVGASTNQGTIVTEMRTIKAIRPEFAPPNPTPDGIYAVFNVSLRQSNGEFATKEFTARLHYQEVPITVANFVGLAEGTYDWYDFQTHTLRSNTPFFDGTEFHRIIENFIIQAGSPDGASGGGPGWTIPDEIVPELKHEGGGVLSMANSSSQGTNLNSGGSQFFITMVPFPGQEGQLSRLDGAHAVFGQIVEGLNVAQEIGQVPLLGSSPHPDWPATIESVKIIRQGASAQAFVATDYWQPPTFRRGDLQTRFIVEDHDDDPDTDRVPVLEWTFIRDRDNHYYIEDSNDLADWRIAHDFRRAVARQDLPIRRDIGSDTASDGRHFYRMLELVYPPLPEPPLQGTYGTNLTLQMDQVDVDPDTVSFPPESLSFTLLSNHQGYWELKRWDNDDMRPIGQIISCQWWNLADKHQVTLHLDGFTGLQAYLTPTSPTSGNAFVHYLSPRPEGVNITGTYTLRSENEGRTQIDKDGLKLNFDIVDTDLQGDPVTTTFEIDFWDQLQEQELDDDIRYEGGWKVTSTNSDFVDIGRLLYHWFEADGKIQLLLNFDTISGIHLQMDSPLAASASADAYFISGAQIETVSYTSGIGDGRPVILDKNLTRLTLSIDLGSEETGKVVVDFWDNSQGSYESTQPDQEEPITGTVFFYEWVESNDETWIELVFDGSLLDMRVFLSETSSGSGRAKVQILENRSVYDATYTIGEGDPRSES